MENPTKSSIYLKSWGFRFVVNFALRIRRPPVRIGPGVPSKSMGYVIWM